MQKLFCVLFVLMIVSISFAQTDSVNAPPYKRFPVVPPFKLLEVDSVSVFSKADLKKNMAVLIILFNPECEHCQHETEEIIKNMDAFRNVQLIMATTATVNKMREFYTKNELDKFSNIKVGQDFQYMLPSFFMIRNLPYLAMYSKKRQLLNTFEGAMKIEDLVKVFR
jgi:thiol-disulfide isomerase/thioredoxin